jgi:hypothetical protein
MPVSFYAILIAVVPLVFFLGRFLMRRKRNFPAGLFAEALKNENNGEYGKAVLAYEIALKEMNKTRFHAELKLKITGKLKVLHTIIEYENRSNTTPPSPPPKEIKLTHDV